MDTTNLTDDERRALSTRVTDERRRRCLASPRALSVGDLAEMLVVERLGLRRAPASTAGYDAEAEDGARYQVKARRLGTRGERQLGVIRNIDRRDFHFVVVVLFPPDADIPDGIGQVPFEVVREKARFDTHQNGHVLPATDAVLADERVERLVRTPRRGPTPRSPSMGDGEKAGASRGKKVGGKRATDSFRSWLTHHKRDSPNVVADHLSRRRRVERELAISLDASVGTEVGLAEVIDRIRNEIPIDAPTKTRSEGQASLIAATWRYAELLDR